MPDQWMRDEVRSAITRESETGGRISRAELQDELGIGASDMTLVLDELREAGLIREEVPGEYDLNPEMQETPANPAVAVVDAAAPTTTAAASAQRGVLMAPGWAGSVPDDEEMRMSRAMIAALDDEGLGRLVKAGIEGAVGEFLLRVVA